MASKYIDVILNKRNPDSDECLLNGMNLPFDSVLFDVTTDNLCKFHLMSLFKYTKEHCKNKIYQEKHLQALQAISP
jgi:hypothetical protein